MRFSTWGKMLGQSFVDNYFNLNYFTGIEDTTLFF